jgi:hypothetical protein
MVKPVWKWLVVAAIVHVLAVGAVVAQTGAGAADRADELASDEDLSLLDEDVEALSNEEKLERGATKIDRMRTTLTSVADLLEEVRKAERDILKINCINEQHAAVKGFVKVAEQSYVNLEKAVRAEDTEAATHQYTLISVAHQRVLVLREEARLCTGEERRFAGRTEVEVVEPRVGPEDVQGPDEEFVYAELPELTPFQ